MTLPDRVTIVEVGPRDGLQSEKKFVPTEQKVRLCELLLAAGVRRLEVTSFVHPKHVPQMADAEEVLAALRKPEGVEFIALVPNVRGMERALECAVDRINLFVSASEPFNLKNLRATPAESLAAAADVAKMAHEAKIKIRGGVVTSFGCPYQGRVPQEAVDRIVDAYCEMGCDEVGIADTTGMTNPAAVKRMMTHLRQKFPSAHFDLHFHNSRGAGLANLLAGLEVGIDTFDSSAGGLGGCPFAPRAMGNIATEDTVNMLHEMGIETGIDLNILLKAVEFAESFMERQLPGQLLHAGIVDWDKTAA